jgi:hypothetical protein
VEPWNRSEFSEPRNIELLAKLARVAPPSVLDPLTERVLDGDITREELRRTW